MGAPQFTSEPTKREKLLPIYIMCDVSSSMGWPKEAPEKPIDAINAGISGILRELREQAFVAGSIYLSIITFGSNAEVVLPLSQVDAETYVPPLEAQGTTNLGDAFETLSKTLDLDYHAIRDRNATAYRPAVFLFTDGVPTGDDGRPISSHESWLQPLNQLKAHPVWAPRVFAYGFGEADEGLLKKMVEYQSMTPALVEALVNFSEDDPVSSLKRIFPALFSTIVDSAAAVAEHVSEEELGNKLNESVSNQTQGASGFWDGAWD